jgi:hypothetical protein
MLTGYQGQALKIYEGLIQLQPIPAQPGMTSTYGQQAACLLSSLGQM